VAIAVTLINPTSALARIVFMVGMDRAALSARGYTLGPCDCNSPSGPVHPRRTPQFPVVPSGPLPRLGPRLPQSQRPHHGQQQGRGNGSLEPDRVKRVRSVRRAGRTADRSVGRFSAVAAARCSATRTQTVSPCAAEINRDPALANVRAVNHAAFCCLLNSGGPQE